MLFVPVSDSSPVQASVAPVAESKVNSLLVERESPVPDPKLKEPRVILNRIRPEVSKWILKHPLRIIKTFPKVIHPVAPRRSSHNVSSSINIFTLTLTMICFISFVAMIPQSHWATWINNLFIFYVNLNFRLYAIWTWIILISKSNKLG